MHWTVFLFNHFQKAVDALGVRNIQFLELEAGVGRFAEDFLFGVLSKFSVPAGHDDVPALGAGQMLDNAKADPLVASSHDDVLESLHNILEL